MTVPIPAIEPRKFQAGDTVTWRREFPDYPSSNWKLSYVALSGAAGSTKIEINAPADGNGYLVTVPSSASKDYIPGVYRWVAYITKADNAERYQVSDGLFEIAPNFAAQAAGYDSRSQTKRTLDAINDLIEGRALAGDAESYSINGRSLTKMKVEELLAWKTRYENFYRQEQDAIRVAKGLGPRRKVLVRFGG